ncbi:MAG TPA: hypothetical protein VKD91_21965, partial [Pyrinomonadaceae bacterium]|nr:hypothetical protein [Pyrinomonadaceae bacterium]
MRDFKIIEAFREPSTRRQVLERASPLAFWIAARRPKSARGLAQSKALRAHQRPAAVGVGSILLAGSKRLTILPNVRNNLFPLLGAAIVMTSTLAATDVEPGFTALSDGKTFDGWKSAEENKETW